jgi:hypothetical protein
MRRKKSAELTSAKVDPEALMDSARKIRGEYQTPILIHYQHFSTSGAVVPPFFASTSGPTPAIPITKSRRRAGRKPTIAPAVAKFDELLSKGWNDVDAHAECQRLKLTSGTLESLKKYRGRVQ